MKLLADLEMLAQSDYAVASDHTQWSRMVQYLRYIIHGAPARPRALPAAKPMPHNKSGCWFVRSQGFGFLGFLGLFGVMFRVYGPMRWGAGRDRSTFLDASAERGDLASLIQKHVRPGASAARGEPSPQGARAGADQSAEEPGEAEPAEEEGDVDGDAEAVEQEEEEEYEE